MMGYSEEIINNHLNKYLNDLVISIQGVIQTINNKFTMNESEFNKKYSESKKQIIINNINKEVEYKIIEVKNTINLTKAMVELNLKKLNCKEKGGKKFYENFENIKKEIEPLFKLTTDNLKNSYNNLKNILSNLIKEYINNDEQETKEITLDIKDFIQDVNFEKVGFLGNLFYNYQDEVNEACKKYSNSLEDGFEKIKNFTIDNCNDLKNKKVELIEMIFNTAFSDFQMLKQNYEKFVEYKNLIETLLKNNGLI